MGGVTGTFGGVLLLITNGMGGFGLSCMAFPLLLNCDLRNRERTRCTVPCRPGVLPAVLEGVWGGLRRKSVRVCSLG